jgi:methyltransferase-like protein
MLDIIRDMMLYHTRGLTDSKMRAARSRQLLGFLTEAVPSDAGAYGSFLESYAKHLQGELKNAGPRGDAFLLHDELETVNEPIYFHQFAERAADHGLQYLAEAQFCDMTDTRFSSRVSETLRHFARDVVEMEQYLDFLHNRTFRRTLLCHDGITLNRTLKPAHVRAFHIASQAQPVSSQPDIHSRTVEKFKGSDGAVLSTDHPISKAGILCLAEIWPRAAPFDTLLSMARSRLTMETETTEEDAHVLGVNLLTALGYSGSLVEFHVHAPHFVMDAGERPVASLVARFQAQASSRVTNMCHVRVRLDEFDRYLLGHLDGSHDRETLVERLMAGPVAEGALKVQEDGEAVQDAAKVRERLAEEVEQKLRWLARAALLIA